MTTDELRTLFASTFGLGDWPLTYGVDAETYGNVCHSVFTSKPPPRHAGTNLAQIHLGPHNGMMFKGIELILHELK